MDEKIVEFRMNLKYYRELRGWSQSQLAVQADSSNGQIGNIESGKAYPSFELIFRLANALKIHPADLFLRNTSVNKEKMNQIIRDFFINDAVNIFEEKLALS